MHSLTPWRRGVALRLPTEPFRLFDQLHDDFSRMLDGDAAASALSAPIDVSESESEICVRAEVPGIEPDKLDVQLTGEVLTIRGEKLDTRDADEGKRTWSERRWGSFARSVQLPCAVDPESVRAEHKHGVVTITLRKADALRPRRIEVKSS